MPRGHVSSGNGAELDANSPPVSRDKPELWQAIEVLRMFFQDAMVRQLYEK